MGRSCFVIMPIGDQHFADQKVGAGDLHARYTDLIKEALLKARPDLEVIRADEVDSQGGITTDIFTRLMHSDYVVADITYPNPNVFYELGIRHACRPGTILLRESGAARIPFDIAPLRHIAYENTPSGLKNLSVELRKKFDWFELHPRDPDNDFLSLAKLTDYAFQDYGRKRKEDAEEASRDAMMEIISNPDLLQFFLTASASGERPDNHAILQKFAEHPEAMQKMFLSLLKSGALKLP
jgi:hypothetical protein